ncbi:YciI family protein [Mesorhizobium plurifarium]|uniref:YciI family protein n=1 Tax=Sinorhizobium arboris TaxID=76745 RepID=UPI0004080F96|nr:YciI family protein [Sinorhizobium arboris]PST24144.1 YciI family protein [Mesorhizobium plurifarium]
MFYAILAYHEENVVESWTREEDDKLMGELLQVNNRLVRAKRLGPAARLGATRDAVTLRGDGEGMIIDGPFAETKEQLLGLYVVDCPSLEVAVETARELRRVNPTAVYEIRPISLYLPGAALSAPEEDPE